MPGGGVVHSFDGTAEERDKILDLGLYIGINDFNFADNSGKFAITIYY